MSHLRWAIVLVLFLPPCSKADDWPQWLGPRRDGVWREKGLVKQLPAGLKPLWRAPLGTGYAGPAVVADRVYVMDRLRPKGPDGKPARPTRKGIPGKERILCLDATSGKEIWKREYECPYTVSYPSGPRVTPVVRDGRVYALGAMGRLTCLDAKDGKVVWQKDLIEEYKLTGPPVWGFACHPLLEGNRLFVVVGGPGSAAVALHKDTGKELWRALTSTEVGYSPPMLVEAGGKKQLIVWLSESVNGLDPATGKAFWKQEYPVGIEPQRPAVNIVSLVPHANRLFLTTYYHGPMMLELGKDKPSARVLWRGKSNSPTRPDGLHGLMATPAVKDGFLYGVGVTGELRCVEAKSGKTRWQTYDLTGGAKSDCGTAFLVRQGDRFVVFNDQGELFLAELTPKGHKIAGRMKLLEPVEEARGRKVVWSHPAFARKCVFARNDKEMVCVSLAEKQS
jgi:outer membrane protein assembly factor BamB